MNLTINRPPVLNNKVISFKAQPSQNNYPISQTPGNLPVPSTNLLQVYFTGKVEKSQTILSTASIEEKKSIEEFSVGLKDFLANAKTNLNAVKEVIKTAEKNGYKQFDAEAKLEPGDKVYFINNDRAVILAKIGKSPVAQGVKIVASHLDSPHITLKAQPLQDSEEFCVFKTMMHGIGSKRYQWVNRHLALEGEVVTKDGKKIDINIGNKPGDKTFIIPDLAPHVDTKENNKAKDFKAEDMMPIVALNSDMEGKISDYVEKILKDKYGIDRDDLLNAELNLVPSENPHDIGFDEGLIGAYGHDDKSCAYASLMAEVQQNEIPEHTTISAFLGNEEIGSDNNYGAKSDFMAGTIGELLESQKGSYNENDLRRTFKRSLALSADVSTAVDPISPQREEKSNACRLGHGLIMKLQGWRNSIPEATASITRMLNRNNVKFQPFAYHQDNGGGATLGIFLATNHNLDVVDVGIPILSMHAPVEIADKGDIFHLYKGIKSFLNNDRIKEIPTSIY